MFQPDLLEGCTKLTSFEKVAEVYGNDGSIAFERTAIKRRLPAVYISNRDGLIVVCYSMVHMYPFELSYAACMTIKNYFNEICTIYDNLDFLDDGSGFGAYPTSGYLNRVHREDAYDIGQSIYDIVMDERNWSK